MRLARLLIGSIFTIHLCLVFTSCKNQRSEQVSDSRVSKTNFAEGGDSSNEKLVEKFYNLRQFVEWENRSQSPVVFCVTGDDGFLALLASYVELRNLKANRDDKVLKVPGSKDSSCHMVFVGPKAELDKADWKGKSVLTVGAQPEFVKKEGGMMAIDLWMDGNKFFVNRRLVSSEGINISSKVLEISSFLVETAD